MLIMGGCYENSISNNDGSCGCLGSRKYPACKCYGYPASSSDCISTKSHYTSLLASLAQVALLASLAPPLLLASLALGMVEPVNDITQFRELFSSWQPYLYQLSQRVHQPSQDLAKRPILVDNNRPNCISQNHGLS